MLSKELLEILVCPEDRTPLTLAEPALLARLNQAVSRRQLKNRSGQTLERPLEAGLVRADNRVVYPVLDGIPVLLVDEAIVVEDEAG
jgi:uncharacterized protein